jgi:hypothetical protein
MKTCQLLATFKKKIPIANIIKNWKLSMHATFNVANLISYLIKLMLYI